ncbi:recombinase [Anaerotignum neopropionicum]|uniref:Recombinase n=1 Tax=Anaerotignum neopropionicum TaxID=36847 RepID=A0A136WDA1_9FIRM|nr:recombinase family protein [Anaerotignum neopropionicum]KXL52493.1 recombinase [Anaerotignum neopropionicum]
MARKSRKNMGRAFEQKEETLTYNAAIYARLSVEDLEKGGPSIETQILIAQKFLEEQEDLHCVDIYIDNGQTGTNFNRPAFSRLMDDLQTGKVNCIIVKDLSRFGRNYLDTGNYLENIFPKMGVRFISVTDKFDSNLVDNQTALMVSLKAILHDSYAKDISKKVSTAIAVKKKSGKFMSRITPYGYAHAKNDKYQLEIQKEQAEIVKKIYRWCLEGVGSAAIARRLNDMGVPTKGRIRFLEGYVDGKDTSLWHGSTVLNILKNPCYFGCLVERKTQGALCTGGITKVIPKEKWNMIENTHEPIITKEVFEKVQDVLRQSALQKNMKRQKNVSKQRTENVFRGLLRCGECGSVLQRDGGYYPKDGAQIRYSYNCPRKYLKVGGCAISAIGEQELREAVFQVCRCQLALFLDCREMNNQDFCGAKSNKMSKEREGVPLAKKENSKLIEKKMTEKESFWRNFLLTIKQKNCGMKMLEKSQNEGENGSNSFTFCGNEPEQFVKFKNPEQLTHEMCSFMIEKIIVNHNHYCLYFAYQWEYDKAVAALEKNAEGDG